MFLPHPRGFKDPSLVAERHAMSQVEQSARPLNDYRTSLAARRHVHVPLFDPAEAGIDTKVLFLFEAPGPMTHAANKRPGSGFISVDNDDATAAAMWTARDQAQLHDGVLCWNIVPWYLGAASRKPTREELEVGAEELVGLLDLLPVLELIVLSGLYAQAGWDRHVAPVLGDAAPATIETWHPSPLSLNQPGRRDEFQASIRQIALLISEG